MGHDLEQLAITSAASQVRYVDRSVTLSELRLHYVDYGGTGEPLVALHGFVQNAHAFDAIAPLLVPHVRLLALDLRGRGGSDWSWPEQYRWSYYLRDVRDFVAALGLSRFALIGTSMGGTLAMLYSMAHPRVVTGLVLNDTSLNSNRAGVIRAGRRIARAPSTFRTISQAMDWFLEERDGLDRLNEEQRLAWVTHFLIPVRGGGFRFNCDPAIIRRAGLAPPNLGPRVPWSHRWSVWQQLERLRMPVLLLRGEKSDVVPRDSAELMVGALPAAVWREVPGVGHAPTLYEPESQVALAEFFDIPAEVSCA
jgi:pimeloyl-ACP methyl ester carboxylesterase